jgi:hypothetical protein
LGNTPTTSVRRLISLLSRSKGLVDQIFFQWLGGNEVKGQQVLAVGGVISSYYSSNPQPRIPYWELGFADITLRLLGSDDFHPQVKAQAASALTKALVEGDLRIPIRGAPPARGDRAGAPTGRAGHPRPSRTSALRPRTG